ncbi:MAG: bifunctional diaminohydroxyphosphoribosylaminopyrimidine deaminase/5-amino-6-(5-phosphoribosylamino)uracil reductase RibD, partial [Chitinophagaceae bacterium]
MGKDNIFMQRCLDLAILGAGKVAPNPMVGAVLVFEEKIIGEGFHRQFGGPHAEVNCLLDVEESDREKVRYSTLYVNLEPCSHFGKTPPCTELIIRNEIPKVIIGCEDWNPEVNGQGVNQLLQAGVEVKMGVL